MARLTEVQKEYIVDRLACYSSPTQVVDLVKDLFGVEIVRQQVQHYDPTVPSTKTPKKWAERFNAVREEYLKTAADVGIAQERWRLERRQLLYDKAERSGNTPLCLQILQDAAKDKGGAYTNHRHHNLSGRVEGGVLAVPLAADESEWDRMARESQAVAHGGG